jgi:hypothetical protein
MMFKPGVATSVKSIVPSGTGIPKPAPPSGARPNFVPEVVECLRAKVPVDTFEKIMQGTAPTPEHQALIKACMTAFSNVYLERKSGEGPDGVAPDVPVGTKPPLPPTQNTPGTFPGVYDPNRPPPPVGFPNEPAPSGSVQPVTPPPTSAGDALTSAYELPRTTANILIAPIQPFLRFLLNL